MRRIGFFHIMVMTLLIQGMAPAGCARGEKDYALLRDNMVMSQIVARGISDARVISAMKQVPRHRFVPPQLRSLAYADMPLPIGSEQTISQPYIVALMTESLAMKGHGKVLEIGTGSGYQAAILAGVADSVYTVEILPELAERALGILDSLGYRAVQVRTGDGFFGWPEKAPFDGIIVTAAAPRIPEPLIEQLRIGGRLVIPVGEENQNLEIYEKAPSGLRPISTVPVRFVPMTGKVRDSK